MGQCENKLTTGVSVNEPRKSAWLYRKLSTSCAIGTTMFFQAYRAGDDSPGERAGSQHVAPGTSLATITRSTSHAPAMNGQPQLPIASFPSHATGTGRPPPYLMKHTPHRKLMTRFCGVQVAIAIFLVSPSYPC